MRLIFFLFFIFYFNNLSSQDTISIESSDYVMVLKTDSLKRLHHIYFGKKMSNPNEYKNLDRQFRFKEKDAADLPGHAYTPSGTWNTAEPALQILHSDGNPSTEL